MDRPTTEQEKRLRAAGWKPDTCAWRTCRVCHRQGMYSTWGWSSPNYSFYHESCIMESPMARRAMKDD